VPTFPGIRVGFTQLFNRYNWHRTRRGLEPRPYELPTPLPPKPTTAASIDTSSGAMPSAQPREVDQPERPPSLFLQRIVAQQAQPGSSLDVDDEADEMEPDKVIM